MRRIHVSVSSERRFTDDQLAIVELDKGCFWSRSSDAGLSESAFKEKFSILNSWGRIQQEKVSGRLGLGSFFLKGPAARQADEFEDLAGGGTQIVPLNRMPIISD